MENILGKITVELDVDSIRTTPARGRFNMEYFNIDRFLSDVSDLYEENMDVDNFNQKVEEIYTDPKYNKEWKKESVEINSSWKGIEYTGIIPKTMGNTYNKETVGNMLEIIADKGTSPNQGISVKEKQPQQKNKSSSALKTYMRYSYPSRNMLTHY